MMPGKNCISGDVLEELKYFDIFFRGVVESYPEVLRGSSSEAAKSLYLSLLEAGLSREEIFAVEEVYNERGEVVGRQIVRDLTDGIVEKIRVSKPEVYRQILGHVLGKEGRLDLMDKLEKDSELCKEVLKSSLVATLDAHLRA